MRPFRSFLLLFFLIACLTGLYYFFPHDRFFPSVKEFIPPSSDTLSATNVPYHSHYARVLRDTIIIPGIKESDSTSFNKPANNLTHFLDSLCESKKQVRIMYYGDSQVEGDRITFWLRQALRKEHGGSGPGLFQPLMPVMYTKSIWLKSSPNWKRYNYLSYKSGELSHNKLGPFMSICRYLPEGEISSVSVKASVRIRPSQFADSAVAEFNVLRIFYSNPAGKVNVDVKSDNLTVLNDSLKYCRELNEVDCDLGRTHDVLIEFEGRVSPDIYCLSIESRNGIIVDNIPQRGSAGLEFTMVDRKNLEESYNKIAPDLIILHYGLNIVKNVRNEYLYYEHGLSRQIARLKETAHSSRLLVIGVTDMASSENGLIESYDNIPSIIKSQQTTADETGASFWDSYSAMGGKSSIILWSKKKPPLAQSDYVHFTYPGADTLSKLLYGALFTSVKVVTPKNAVLINTPDTAGMPFPETKISIYPITRIWLRTRALLSRVFSYNPDKPFIFSNPAFWLFFLFVMAGYSLIYKKLFIRNFYLLLVSLFFYYKSGGLFLFLLVIVTVIDFTSGWLIYKSRKKIYKKLFILLSLLSNFGILAYFKYTGFFINAFNGLLGTSIQAHNYLAMFSNLHLGTSFNINQIILPVGISFFTFQSLSYTIDVYRGKLLPVRNIIDFGFYVSFFPQLVAGPIVRAAEFIPQLYTRFNLSKREFGHALFLILKGLIKKIIISDFIAINFIDRVFDLPATYSGFENLMAIYGYGLQIYCDFSGYTDIAIGLGLLMGFRLPVNFNSPYKASSISDFWKRWHISLSRWLRDYLYISLGGNRKGRIRTYFNLLVTMLLGGLWHGAAFRFILWGGMHGIGLILNKIWDSVFGERFKPWRLGRAIAVFTTFNFVSFCWIFFRAPDMGTAGIMLRQIAENFSPGSYLTVLSAYSNVFMLIAAGYLIHFLPERFKESYRGVFIRIPLIAKLVVVIVVAMLLQQMKTPDIMPFIYFRF